MMALCWLFIALDGFAVWRAYKNEADTDKAYTWILITFILAFFATLFYALATK